LLKGEVADGQTVIVDYDRTAGAMQFTVKTVDGAQRDAAAA
jgi:hypothetical protein